MAFMPVTLAVGATTTPEIAIPEGHMIVALTTDANLTGTALTFTAARYEGGTHQTVYGDDSVAIAITVTTNRYYALRDVDLIAVLGPLRVFKIISGTTQATNPSVINIIYETL